MEVAAAFANMSIPSRLDVCARESTGTKEKKESATLAPPPILKHVDTVWSWVDSTRVSVLSTPPPPSHTALFGTR